MMLYIHFHICVLLFRARPGSYSCVPSRWAAVYLQTHTLNSMAGLLIVRRAWSLVLRGDCIRTMPSSGCSRENGGWTCRKRKTTNHCRHPTSVEVETKIVLLTTIRSQRHTVEMCHCTPGAELSFSKHLIQLHVLMTETKIQWLLVFGL